MRAFLRLVVIEHSIFALPFAFLAALTAMARPLSCFDPHPLFHGPAEFFDILSAGGDPSCTGLDIVQWRVLGLITVAMVAARTFAMAANRLIDREIDARNPRTAQRELVTGVVSRSTAMAGAFVALAVFLVAAAALGPLPLVLAPLAVLPLIGYPYAKRVTDFPHAVLALAQAVAPIGAWIAVTGHWSWSAVILGLAVGLWIGGFDLIYACQDAEVDRVIGVRSVPARFGVRTALIASAVVHAVTFALFLWFGVREDFGPWWYVGLAITAVAFCYEHAIVRPSDLSRVTRSFFTTNGFVGIALFGFGLVDLLTRGAPS
ncbi:MAG: 4-hydroxybenzoate polyprenyltransferase [Frankiaceae bacterium]|nr:4-hydroxybenzoate polyprenyltransferase [Frankiaceae bacterium]